MAHITLQQLTTVLQRIVSWATSKFAAKNTYSGKLEYADMPVVVLASMGPELDGTSTQRPMSAGSTYFLPAEQGASARIMFVTALGQPVKISDPDSGVIYCNAYTGLLYRWDSTTSQMVSVGGGGDGLRKVYVNIASSPADFSNLNALHSAETSGVYQVIDQSSQKIIGILVVSSDNNPYLVTQWLFSTLVLSNEFSGSLTGAEYTYGRAHIIHRFYNVSNTSYSDVPLNTWGEWKVYGLTLDEMSEIFNSKVSTISVNGGTPAQPDTNGNVNLVIEAGGLSEADIDVSSNQDGTVDFTFGESSYTVNLNHTHENMCKLVMVDDEPLNPANDTIYAQVDDLTTPTEIQSLWIAGLPFVGGSGGDDDSPKLTLPAGSNIDFNGESTKIINVKGKNLTGALSLAVTGDFTVTSGGSSVSSISASDANTGVQLTVTKGSGFNTGTLIISSATSEFESKTFSVIDSQAYVQLTAVKFTKQQYVITDIYPGANTRLEIDMKFDGVQTEIDSNTQTRNFIQCNKGSGTKVFSFNTNTTTYPKRISYYVEDVISGDTNLNMTYDAALNSARSTMIWDNSTKKVTFLGQDFTVLQKTSTMPNPMYIGGQMSGYKVFGEFDIILYGVKHYENNVLAHDYVPVKSPNGVVGLYDEVTDTFISSETQTPLVEIQST